jgi:hypothetical protein
MHDKPSVPQVLRFLLAGIASLTACGGSPPVPEAQVGQEIAPEAGADQGGATPQGKVAITEAEMKAAARRARLAQKARSKPANNRTGQPGQGGAAPAAAEDPDDAAPADEARATPPEEEELPRDPSPPTTVPVPADVAMPPADSEKSRTGLVWKVLKRGTGAIHPTPGSKVVVQYSGWTTDGKLFDSSVLRGQALRIPLSNVIPGWREGVLQMVVGEKRRLWIPEKLAYAGRAGAPQGMLVFDVELMKIE